MTIDSPQDQASPQDLFDSAKRVLYGRSKPDSYNINTQIADTATRLKAIAHYNLENWQEAIQATIAVAYGPFIQYHFCQSHGQSINELCVLLVKSKSVLEANRVLQAFRLGRKMDYSTQAVILALTVATSTEPFYVNHRIDCIKNVANLAGLIVQTGKYRFFDSAYGYKRQAETCNLFDVLACGQATLDGTAIDEVLKNWAMFSSHRQYDFTHVTELNLTETVRLLNQIRKTIFATISVTGNSIILKWNGIYMIKEFSIMFDEQRERVRVIDAKWWSQMRAPNLKFNLEPILAHTGCISFSPLIETLISSEL